LHYQFAGALQLSSALYKSAPFLQNEPNLPRDKTNATSFAAKVYENKPPLPQSKKRTQSNPNEPNFKIGNINISTARTKAYINEQRTISNERYSKRTQSNPIFPHFSESPLPPWDMPP
jgi:hypothetical protein